MLTVLLHLNPRKLGIPRWALRGGTRNHPTLLIVLDWRHTIARISSCASKTEGHPGAQLVVSGKRIGHIIAVKPVAVSGSLITFVLGMLRPLTHHLLVKWNSDTRAGLEASSASIHLNTSYSSYFTHPFLQHSTL